MSDVYENKLVANTFVDSSITDSEEDRDTEAESECPPPEYIIEDSLFPSDLLDDHLFDMHADLVCGIDYIDGFDSGNWPQHAERANELVLELFDNILF